MKILLSNPDAMGDLILRQPLFAALQKAGHELVLLVRPPWRALAAILAPGAHVLAIPGDPYRQQKMTNALAELFRGVRALAPQLLVVARLNRTRFDEKLSAEFPDVPALGLRSRNENSNPGTASFPSGLARTIQIDETLHEGEKNRLLAEAIIGKTPAWPRPSIEACPALVERARHLLARLGWESAPFWVVAAASASVNPCGDLRNWREERWVELLRHITGRHGSRVLLLGSPEEQAMNRRIIDALGPDGGGRVNTLETNLDELIGLVSLAQGYVGRDTGTMHLAAALSKPVLALFGGGHWPRFLPAAPSGRVLTLDVPCRGCAWECPFVQAYCVKEIPVEAVTAAFDDLYATRGGSRGDGVQIQSLPRCAALAARMEAEAIAGIRGMRRDHAKEVRELGNQLDKTRHELAVTRGQVRALAASRWRRMGKKLGFVKPLPFETERKEPGPCSRSDS